MISHALEECHQSLLGTIKLISPTLPILLHVISRRNEVTLKAEFVPRRVSNAISQTGNSTISWASQGNLVIPVTIDGRLSSLRCHDT